MSRGPAPIYCDHCKKLKGPENHWFFLRREVLGGLESIIICKTTTGYTGFDLCGEACLLKKLSLLLLPRSKEETFPGDPTGDCEQ
jgi:hypothetical protein